VRIARIVLALMVVAAAYGRGPRDECSLLGSKRLDIDALLLSPEFIVAIGVPRYAWDYRRTPPALYKTPVFAISFAVTFLYLQEHTL
jgi:hypothetical protein